MHALRARQPPGFEPGPDGDADGFATVSASGGRALSIDHLQRSRRNWFAATDVWRAGERRRDDAWIRGRLDDDSSCFVPVWRLHSLVSESDALHAVLLQRADVGDLFDQAGSPIFLGQQGSRTCFALELPDTDRPPEVLVRRGRFCDLRDVAALLDREHGALLAYARAMVYWHRRHRFCGECAARTDACFGGHQRVCTACGAREFPRTDPAVIMRVLCDERCLLGRQSGWPPGLYSTLAGFVEPGESIEDAVVREVREEVGVEICSVEYHSSQPWPFPSSLMLGFSAQASDTSLTIDDDEIADAFWVTRNELVEALGKGRIRLPRRHSIAFRLIEEWFAEGSERRLSALAGANDALV